MTTVRLDQDINYLSGQIDALRVLVLALAQAVPKDFFREQGLQRLENLRTILNAEPVEESRLIAVDHAIDWLKHVT